MHTAVDNIFTPFAAFLIALLVSVGVIPVMIRIAPRLGMIDKPDLRKVHKAPIARVGGLGIAIGAILAFCVLAPRTPFMLSFTAGASILALFGAWDDARELGHYTKFIGQFAAAAIVIWGGNVWIEQLPFLAAPLPPWIGKPFTLVAIVGVINATNHSDGLDGLAGGETLLSLGALSCLAYLTGSVRFLVFTAAVGGGLLGFVRFNTYPAKVFMGDLGSQFLGFSVGVLAITLTQQVNPSLGACLALLLVGLPVIDIVAVLYQRIRGGMNWFRATRNHIHHRLLDLGFDHYQVVLIIYAIQATLTFVAIFVCYESDALILTIYFGVAISIFFLLVLAEKRGWRLTRAKPSLPTRFMAALNETSPLLRAPLLFVQISIPLYLIISSAEIGNYDTISPIRIYLLILTGLLAVLLTLGVRRSLIIYRLSLYSSIGMIAYCIYSAPAHFNVFGATANLLYFLGLSIAISLMATLNRIDDFAATNMDFLIIAGLITAASFSQEIVGTGRFWIVVIGTTVVFYACELIILRGTQAWNRLLGASAVGGLGIIVARLFL